MKQLGKRYFYVLFFIIGWIATVLSDGRYDLVIPLLNNYQRPFTVLDIGAVDYGSCSCAIAHKYEAVCVMVSIDDLVPVCKAQHNLDSLIALHTFLAPKQLRHLGECEHFDVVLAFDFFKNYGSCWQDAIDAFVTMGDHVIIEIPCNNISMKTYVEKKGGCFLGTVCNEQSFFAELYEITLSNQSLKRTTWFRPACDDEHYYIESSFERKQLIKHFYEYTEWVPGINLCTFKMCHGSYPTTAMLKEQLKKLDDKQHTDWFMNNIIVQGNKLALIDGTDAERSIFFNEKVLQAHVIMLDLQDPEDIEAYFFNKLVNVDFWVEN